MSQTKAQLIDNLVQPITGALGSAAAPTFSFTADPNTGLFSPGADAIALATAGTNRLHITSAGNVGIGTTAPGAFLEVSAGNRAGSGQGGSITVGGDVDSTGITNNTRKVGFINVPHYANATGKMALIFGDSQASENIINIGGSQSNYTAATSIAFYTAANNTTTIGTERGRWDSSGRFLVGTSTSSSVAIAGDSRLQIVGNNAGNAGIVTLSRSVTAVNTAVLGQIVFADNVGRFAQIDAECDGTPGTNDYPGRIVFSTTADGAGSPTERMRIANDGIILVNNTDLSGARLAVQDTSTTNTVFYGYAKTASYTGNILSCQTQTASGTGFNLQVGFVNVSTKVYQVRGNGDVQNTNNSYGSISDIKLKENIVDANSQWEDLKAFQVRNYNFKEETGHQSHTQIGLVAQEVELVSPGLVSESPDRDEDGNDLNTVTKSVNYSVLYMKAVKALQEAMERIETLEAKVAALEGA